jgi:hypothetical protein
MSSWSTPVVSQWRLLAKAILVPSGEIEGCSSLNLEEVTVSGRSSEPSAFMR